MVAGCVLRMARRTTFFRSVGGGGLDLAPRRTSFFLVGGGGRLGMAPVPFTCSELVLLVDWPDGPARRERAWAPTLC